MAQRLQMASILHTFVALSDSSWMFSSPQMASILHTFGVRVDLDSSLALVEGRRARGLQEKSLQWNPKP